MSNYGEEYFSVWLNGQSFGMRFGDETHARAAARELKRDYPHEEVLIFNKMTKIYLAVRHHKTPDSVCKFGS